MISFELIVILIAILAICLIGLIKANPERDDVNQDILLVEWLESMNARTIHRLNADEYSIRDNAQYTIARLKVNAHTNEVQVFANVRPLPFGLEGTYATPERIHRILSA